MDSGMIEMMLAQNAAIHALNDAMICAYYGLGIGVGVGGVLFGAGKIVGEIASCLATRRHDQAMAALLTDTASGPDEVQD